MARISQDLEERLSIMGFLEAQAPQISTETRLLLDVYMSSIKIMNARDQRVSMDTNSIKKHYALSNANFQKFVQKYPNESYIKAEYIEVLNAQLGPKVALDSLKALVASQQTKLPFFIAYKALLQAELGHFTQALENAHALKSLESTQFPAIDVLYAQIYHKMDSLQLANTYIEQAIAKDNNHLIARRLKKILNEAVQ